MKRFLVATILMLVLALSGCGGYDGPESEQGTPGVEVTADVPYAYTTGMDNEAYPSPIDERVIPIMRR